MSPIDTIKHLDTDNVAKEILSDFKNWTERISILTVEILLPKGYQQRGRYFSIPIETDKLVAFLFDLSLSNTIEHGFRTVMASNRKVLTGYSLYLVPSTDGQTNITPEFIDLLASIKTAYEPITVAKFK